MPRLASILALSLATAAMPAAAQYAGQYPPAGAPPVNTGPYTGSNPFTGLRVEGQVGFDRLQDHGHKDGADYGVALGYDLQYRRFVLGVEGEVADSSTKVCGGDEDVDGRLCLRADRDFYVGGRVGTAVTPQALLYAKAGYTNARVKATLDQAGDRFNLGHSDLDGVRVGAGVEYQLFANAYAKAEYRYSNYEDHLSRNQVVGGFGVRF